MKFSFIILHYLEGSIEFTKKCILSILNLKQEQQDHVQIVVVDNGSNDKSEAFLMDYRDNFGIEILILDKNQGFAFPINKAYKFSKKTLNPDFYIALNNDTEIVSPDFLNKVKSAYIEYDYDMMGPKILNNININQNPYNSFVGKELNWLEKMLLRTEKSINYIDRYQNSRLIRLLHFRYLLKSIILKIVLSNDFTSKIYSKIRGRKFTVNHRKIANEIQVNVALHGSAIIFSSKFTDRFDFLFYPKDYFFVEEDILYYLAISNKLTFVYNPEVIIKHYEDVSTNLFFQKSIEARKWKLNQTLLSLREFKKIID